MTETVTVETVDKRLWAQQDNLEHVEQSSRQMKAANFRAHADHGNLRFVPPGEGNLVTSLVEPGRHLPILDLDLPHAYVPSSTPGHGHLYLNSKVLDDNTYFTMMVVLEQYGVVSRGSVEQLKAYSASMVRAPGTYKHPPEDRW